MKNKLFLVIGILAMISIQASVTKQQRHHHHHRECDTHMQEKTDGKFVAGHMHENVMRKKTCNCTEKFDNQTSKLATVRPLVSPSVLMNIFEAIFKKTGIYPDVVHQPNHTVFIKHKSTGKCLGLSHDGTSTYKEVMFWECKNTSGIGIHRLDTNSNELVHLEHVGDGYVSMTIEEINCIGTGYDPLSHVYVTTAKGWCPNSPSHNFAIIQRGDHVVFQQKETKRCLTMGPNMFVLYTDDNYCKENDINQQFVICNPVGTKCWP